MFCKQPNGTVKEVYYVCVTFFTYALAGINRSYLSFLYYQLDLPDSYIHLNKEEKSWIAAFINLLSPLGCLLIGITMDGLGRKFTIQAMFVPYLVSWIVIAFATNVWMFYAAALVQGISLGMSIGTSIYVSEISTVNHRGALLGTIEIAFNVGVLLCNLLLYYFKWQTVSIIFAAFAVASLLLSFTLPESPTWLYLKGKQQQSIETLVTLRCKDRDAIKDEIEDMEKFTSSQVKRTFGETVRQCVAAWRQFLLVFTLFFLQQNTGYSIMTMFVIMIIDSLHVPFKSTDIALIYSLTCAAAGFITPYAMHKYSRKSTLTVSAIGMAVSTSSIAIYKHVFDSSDEKPFTWIIPLALCLYITTASIGVLPIGFTAAGEFFPNEVRGVMNGIYGVIAHIYWVFLYKMTPWYLETFGGAGVMWTFAAFSAVTAVLGIFVLPETKGKSLNEVQEKYFKRKTKTKEEEA